MNNQEINKDDEQKKYTLIINYPTLWVGGVEWQLAILMRLYLKAGHRVIWLTTSHYRENMAFPGLLEAPGLEIIIWEKWNRLLGTPKINFQKDERVIMITCRAMHYAAGEALRRKAGTRNFKHIYTVAHHSGPAYYPDRCMSTAWGKRLAYRYWRKTLQRLDANNWLYCFDGIQLENYETHYQILIPDIVQKMVPSVEDVPVCFDEENTSERELERQSRFVITTCARFEFPHKGYMLGLVDSFAKLKERYPHLVLQIIGDGEDRDKLMEKIAELPAFAARDIILTGAVSPDELESYYKKSHVIVGLAGAIVEGAWSGIPSIVVRHECNVCEAYGFYEDAFEKSLCEEEGDEITPLLEHSITMSREEYLRHGRESFNIVKEEFSDLADCADNCYFEHEGMETAVVEAGLWERIIGRFLYLITELKNYLGR